MADLEQMKKSWKVLDENLQKSEIINQEQIKKITMEKIQTTFDVWKHRNKYNPIIALVITVFFVAKWILAGFIWQAFAWLIIMTFLYIVGLRNKRSFGSLNIQSLSIAELSCKIEQLKLRNAKERLLIFPVLAAMIFIMMSTSNLHIPSIIGFIFGAIAAFVWGYIDTRKKFILLEENIQELKDLQAESE